MDQSIEGKNYKDTPDIKNEEAPLGMDVEVLTATREDKQTFSVDHQNNKNREQDGSTDSKPETGVEYMDAPILEEDVIKAGGLGARDDISSFLPVAVDSTDFEASLRDARDFEEPPQGEMSRHGLGWSEPSHAD